MNKNSVLFYKSELIEKESPVFSQTAAMAVYKPFFVCTKTNEEIRASYSNLIEVNISDFSEDSLPFSLKPKVKFSYLLEELEKNPAALMYALSGPDAVEALPIAESLNIPLVVAYQGYEATLSENSIRSGSLFLRRYLFWKEKLKEKANLFLCSSSFIAEALKKQGFPENKIKIHHTGAEVHLFNNKSNPKREAIVLFVGELAEKSGCIFMLKAMQIVQQKFPLLRLLIVGDGPDKFIFKKFSQELKINVEFSDSLNGLQVRSLLTKALIFCLPCVAAKNGESESIPQILLEAQAAGCPVVCTNHGGIPEAVLEGITAEMADEKNVGQLASAIETFAKSEYRRRTAEEEGPKFISSKFNILEQTKLLETYFSQTIMGSRC